MWVKLGMWRLPNRDSVWAFFWLSFVCALASGVYAWWDRRFLLGLLLLLSALWYWLTIRWVDQNGHWDEGDGA